MCLVCMSWRFVPSWNFKRIHSPRAPKLEEVEVTEWHSILVPAGREFLCRIEVLGVPGTLDGLSHVVSDGAMNSRVGETIKLGGQHQLSYFLLTVLKIFVGKNKGKWFHPKMQTWHMQSAVKLDLATLVQRNTDHTSCRCLPWKCVQNMVNFGLYISLHPHWLWPITPQ